MLWYMETEVLYKQALVFRCLQYKPFQNTVGEGEIGCNKQFLLFPNKPDYLLDVDFSQTSPCFYMSVVQAF